MQILILILTKDCNLRCSYCHVKKQNINMPYKISEKAILFFLKIVEEKNEKNCLIRFFGGEPLLVWDTLIKSVTFAQNEANKRNIKVEFDVTTNGILLDTKKINFCRKQSGLELILSLDGEERDQKLNRKWEDKEHDSIQNILHFNKALLELPNHSVNMVISPNQVANFYKNFSYVYKLGFSKINILPALFVFWSTEEINILRKEFEKVLKFIKTKPNLLIKNVLSDNRLPLFNEGLVVDCGGDIYSNNLFLSKFFTKISHDFKIGNILLLREIIEKKTVNEKYLINKIIRNIDTEIYYSTLKVDAILYFFIEKIKLFNSKVL